MTRPTRLHHAAAVVKDLAATRSFYTEVVGLPHVATWCEELEDGQSYCHAFFELVDQSVFAFFQFADSALYEANKRPENLSPFQHVAFSASRQCKEAIEQRAIDKGIPTQRMDHGYCESLYLADPDNYTVEITTDYVDAAAGYDARQANAQSDLTRWLSGDYTINNHAR